MIALLFLMFFAIYFAIALGVTLAVARFAQKKQARVWPWVTLSLAFFYLLIFWDWIPTQYLFHAYCKADGGFRIYKTVEQWKAEHPGVAETLRYEENRRRDGMWQLNQRFIYKLDNEPLVLSLSRVTKRVIDRETGEVLGEYINYSSGVNLMVGRRGLTHLKPWLSHGRCPVDVGGKSERKFGSFVSAVRRIGEGEN